MKNKKTKTIDLTKLNPEHRVLVEDLRFFNDDFFNDDKDSQIDKLALLNEAENLVLIFDNEKKGRIKNTHGGLLLADEFDSSAVLGELLPIDLKKYNGILTKLKETTGGVDYEKLSNDSIKISDVLQIVANLPQAIAAEKKSREKKLSRLKDIKTGYKTIFHTDKESSGK